jgi:gliding motility-associated-like protein
VVTTTYNVTVTDNCGLDSTFTITVNVPVYPPLVIGIDDAQLCLGESLFVIPSVTGGAGNNTYAWNGPAGVTFNINQANGQTAFDGPVDGVYIVSVTDLCGTTDADTANYTFVGCEITIPNVISPNGDGANDMWHLINLEYHPNTVVQIFNRWGVLVYESSNYQNDWTADGLSDGTYFYIVVPVREGYGPYHGTVTVTGNN